MKTADLRRLVASLDNGAWGEEPDGDGTEIRCVRAADFDFARLRATVDTAPIRKIAPAQRRRLSLGRGDLILEKSGGGEKQVVGRAVLYDCDVPAVCSNFAARLRPTPSVAPRYLAYLLAALYFDGATARCVLQTTGIQNLDTDAWLQTEVPVLELDQQLRIADFLDGQVARIDQIIAARRTQIDLIAEDLQGQIDRTTSFGDRRRLAPLLKMLRDGTHTPPPRVNLGVPLLTAKNVKDQRLALTATDTAISQTDADLLDGSFAPRSGDVLLSVKGSVGNVAVVPKLFPRFQVERNLAVLRPARQVLVSEWLYWCLRSQRVQDQIRLAMGFSAQPGVYLGDLASLLIAVPGTGEQASEAATLDAYRDSTASASTTLQSSIGLLSELKRSLITAAVTGEFDVSTAGGSRVSV